MTWLSASPDLVRTATVLPGPDRHGVQLSPLTDEQHCHPTGLECAVLNGSTRDTPSPKARQPMLIGRPSPKGDPRIARYMPLARSFARKYAGELPLHTFDDLLSIAMEALWRATERWVPERGATFVTFAGQCITHALWQEAKKTRTKSRIPLRAFVSTNRDEDEEAPIHLVSTDPGPEEILDSRRKPVLDAALASLKEQERVVVAGVYFADRTLAEVGAALGFSRQRAQQIESKAMAKMRRVAGRRNG